MRSAGRPINFLPGPVAIHDEVRRALARPPVSHRSDPFMAEMAAVRRDLCRMTGAPHVEVLLGSGTLANEAVAAQLSLFPGRGAVLVNGEFGARLASQARRWRLAFTELAAGWGEPLPLAELRRALQADPEIRWVWAVHCETSTGVLNDLTGLTAILGERGVALCLDGISSIGNVPVDLSGVHLATGVSGKGLASFPGLALVFHAETIEPAPHLPHYLDLGSYACSESVPFTISTNLVSALSASLARFARRDGFAARRRLAAWLRPSLERLGFSIMAPEPIAAPMVLTLLPPPGVEALVLGEALEEQGIWLSYLSGYLVERNLLQVCLMGEHHRWELAELLNVLASLGVGLPAAVRQAEKDDPRSFCDCPIPAR
ncbi:MAG TPA: aminotransferase class V-fold PLP-dependent enzyme [Thermoanaerobaculia bacterium]|nr:aminotransferase class V-fold PLP-dependent enzyme [Thermoanaerobaculia bacterium]